jgi:hypothetical protein
MMRVQTVILLLLLLGNGLLTGCTTEAFKHAGYDALHQRQCIEQTGQPNCDPNYPSYEEYKRQRAEIPEN